MKKIVTLSLIVITLISMPAKSFALKVQGTKAASSLIDINLTKPDKYPWTNEDMTAHCLGVVEVKIKNPQELMQSSEIHIGAKEESLCYHFNPFEPRSFLHKLPRRQEVNSFKLDGIPVKTNWYSIHKRFLNWIVDERVHVNYRLVPINSFQANILKAKPLKIGQKKTEVKANEALDASIARENEKSEAAKLSEELLKRAINGLNDPKVDPYDPYNVVGNGNILKYAAYKEQVNRSNYYSKKEVDAKNKEISLAKMKVCDELAEAVSDDLKKFDVIAKLSSQKPIQNFAIVVNNNIDGNAEAYKLTNLVAYHGYKFINYDQSVIELDGQKVFIMPENGIPSDQEQIDTIMSEIADTKSKPGFKQWTKNMLKLAITRMKKILPKFVTDFVGVTFDSAIILKDKVKSTLNYVPAPAPPQQPQQGGNGGPGGQPQQQQPAAQQPMVMVNVNSVPQDPNRNNVEVSQKADAGIQVAAHLKRDENNEDQDGNAQLQEKAPLEKSVSLSSITGKPLTQIAPGKNRFAPLKDAGESD